VLKLIGAGTVGAGTVGAGLWVLILGVGAGTHRAGTHPC